MTEEISLMFWKYLPGIIQAVTTGLVVWVWWSLKRVFVTRAGFENYKTDISARLKTIETRQYERATALQEINAKLDSLPTSEQLQDLALSLRGVEGDIQGLRGELGGLSHATKRLEKAVDMFTEVHMR